MSDDNVQIKDALSDEFSFRTRDVSPAGDGSLQRSMVYATPYPVDVNVLGIAGGAYHHTAKSGSMAAGLASAAPIYTFLNPSASVLQAIIKRVKLSAWSLGTGFAAGIATFDMFVARAFTADDTGGAVSTLTGNNAKLRTGVATCSSIITHATTGTLTAGTRVLDTGPLESWNIGIGTAINTSFNPTEIKLLEKLQGEYPLVLAPGEGFVIQATVPATGIWQFAMSAEWDELAQF